MGAFSNRRSCEISSGKDNIFGLTIGMPDFGVVPLFTKAAECAGTR
jgi:hypothetical protein